MECHGSRKLTEFARQLVDECHVIALDIAHDAPHPRVAFADTQVIRRIGLGRFALGPVPVPTVLQIDDIHAMIVKDTPPRLDAEIVS